MKRSFCLSLFVLSILTWQADAQEEPKAVALSNLTKMLETFEPTEKKIIEEARDAESPALDLITGIRYGKDESDPGLHLYWKIERKPDGTALYTDLTLYHDDKEYIQNTDDLFHWVLIGRLIIEVYPDDTEFVMVQVIDEVGEKILSYRGVVEGLSMEDWFLDKETRDEVKFPEVPAGYKKLEE